MVSFLTHLNDIILKLHTDNVYIIGKGRSIDKVSLDLLRNGLIINLNDSERIIPGQVCLFHRPWVITSLKETGFLCDYYITDCAAHEIPPSKLINVDYVQFNLQEIDSLIKRFLSKNFLLEEFLFVNALKLANLISTAINKRLTAYLLGFDFDFQEDIYSQHIKVDYSRDEINYKRSFIRSQELILLELLHIEKEYNFELLEIVHVGLKPYSKINTTQFNMGLQHGLVSQSLPPSRTIHAKSGKIKGNLSDVNNHVLVVAELTTNHLGDHVRLKEMIHRAAEAGADYVKVQKRDVESFYTKKQLDSPYDSPFGKTLRDYRLGLELSQDGFEILEEECKKCGIDWFATVLDFTSYLFIKKFNKRIIKIPSTISEKRDQISLISKDINCDVVVSTGFADASYEQFILNCFNFCSRIYLMHTTSAYPTAINDCQIAVVRHYRILSEINNKICPAYSSHDEGHIGSMLAVAAGAIMIEKHVKLGDTKWIHFNNVALDLKTDAFKKYVDSIRLAEEICGYETKRIKKGEHHKYLSV